MCSESDCDQLEKVDEVSTPSVEPEGLRSPQPYDLSHTLSTSPTSQTSPAPANSSETNRLTSPIVIADVHSRLPLATVQNVDNSISLDDLPCGMSAPDSLVPRLKSPEELFNALQNSDTTSECEKSDENYSDSDDSKPEFDTDSKFNYLDKLLKTVSSPETEVPRLNSLEKYSTSLYASESISEYLQSNDDLSDSEDSDSEHKFKPSSSEEVDLNKAPQDWPPEEIKSLNVTAPSSTCPSRARAYKYWTCRSPPVKRSQLRNQPMQNSSSYASGSMSRELPRPMNLLPRAAISSALLSCSA